jgi:hypothetical protein
MSSGAVVDRRDERSKKPRAAGARPERGGHRTRVRQTQRHRWIADDALWQHPPYFHDGSAPDLPAVVELYDERGLNLTPEQKADLVKYLKSS